MPSSVKMNIAGVSTKASIKNSPRAKDELDLSKLFKQHDLSPQEIDQLKELHAKLHEVQRTLAVLRFKELIAQQIAQLDTEHCLSINAKGILADRFRWRLVYFIAYSTWPSFNSGFRGQTQLQQVLEERVRCAQYISHLIPAINKLAQAAASADRSAASTAPSQKPLLTEPERLALQYALPILRAPYLSEPLATNAASYLAQGMTYLAEGGTANGAPMITNTDLKPDLSQRLRQISDELKLSLKPNSEYSVCWQPAKLTLIAKLGTQIFALIPATAATIERSIKERGFLFDHFPWLVRTVKYINHFLRSQTGKLRFP